MTRVVNVRNEDFDVYIGRTHGGYEDVGFGNPFMIGRDGFRDDVIRLYETWIRKQPELLDRTRKELKGKRLGCWCKPLSCHGDVLVRIAEEPVE